MSTPRPSRTVTYQGTRLRKWVTRLLAGGVATTLVVIGLAYRLSMSRKDRAVPATQGLPGNINQQLSGYTFTRSDEGRRIFTVHASRTIALKQGGTTVLEDVKVEFFGQAMTLARKHRQVCSFETHRSRSLFNPWLTLELIRQLPDLLFTSDTSAKYRFSRALSFTQLSTLGSQLR